MLATRLRIGVWVALVVMPPALWATEPPPPRSSTASAPIAAPAEEEPEQRTVVGSLIRIDRRAEWPRLDLLNVNGDSSMLELPASVTLAWDRDHSVALDEVPAGRWMKVYYVRVGVKKRVKSVQLLPGFRRRASAAGGDDAPHGIQLPASPVIPPAPQIVPAPPTAPTVGSTAIPTVPQVPSADSTRRSRY